MKREYVPVSTVECNGCTKCCRGQIVQLSEGDDPSLYETVPSVKLFPSHLPLAIPVGPDGACIYLKDDVCTIYENRPNICRHFSCVGFVESMLAQTTRQERRHDPAFKKMAEGPVWKEGRDRLRRMK